jgi:hypothetical protein
VTKRLEPILWLFTTGLLVASIGAAFYVPGIIRTGGRFPVPLDDVYIHFGFARAAALGHPFEWIPGNGYSSGGTSLTYPLVLAPGYLLGMRGERLALFAAGLAFACLLDLCRSIRALLGPFAPRWVTWAMPALFFSVPLVDWSLFSGMETALFAALLGRALLGLSRAVAAPPLRRRAAQLRLGVWAALLIATRPETAPLALLLGLSSAHAARSLPLPGSLLRSMGPSIVLLAGQAAANRALTGEWSAAGAVRKLIGSNPYMTPLDVAGEVIKNLVALRAQALGSALGGGRLSWVVPLLGLAAALSPRTRRLALPLLLGAYAALLLVSLNATARFQNLRYAAPSLLMLLAAGSLGVGVVARLRPKPLGPALAALAALTAALAPLPWFPAQIDHFSRASANIAGQQVEVAHRLAELRPRPRRVLVGDAGAIPYLSGIDAIDGLGLGGYRGLPFARASVHGVPAVVELIERLPEPSRPDVLALYPSWWAGLADVFGRRVDAVRIADNVICAADEKVIYAADWSSLGRPGEVRPFAVDELDVADLVDERAHRYEIPAPRGGWVIGAVLPEGDRPRFDAGRIIPEGRREAFRVRAGVSRGGAHLMLRTDGGGPARIRVVVERAGRTVVAHDIDLPARSFERWFEITAPLEDISGDDRVSIFAVRGAFRSFHSWLVRK